MPRVLLLFLCCFGSIALADAKGDLLLPPAERALGLYIEINAQRVADGESRLTSVKGSWGRKGAWFRLVRDSAPPARIFLDEAHWWLVDDVRNCRERAGGRHDLEKVWGMPEYLAGSFIEAKGRHLILVEQGAPAKGEALDSYRLRGQARMATGERLKADVVFEVNRDTGQVVSSFGTLIEARAGLGARKLTWTARLARPGEIRPVVVPPECAPEPEKAPVAQSQSLELEIPDPPAPAPVVVKKKPPPEPERPVFAPPWVPEPLGEEEKEAPEPEPASVGCDKGCLKGTECFTYPAFAGGQSVCLRPCQENKDCADRPGTLCNCPELSDGCRTWFDDAPEGACVPAP